MSTTFDPAAPVRSTRRLGPADAWRVVVAGLRLPKPRTRATPGTVGLRYESHVLRGHRGLALHAWWIPHARPRASVAVFHGYLTSKSDLLREVAAFHELGFDVLLVDFHGSGDSAGNESAIGFTEAEDVVAALHHAARLSPRPAVAYGVSMGAAAVMRAAAVHDLPAAALVADAPFDNLLTTVRHRFAARGLPPWPAAETLLLWGSLQQGFDAFAHNPADYAVSVRTPTLLAFGSRDPWVRPEEGRRIYDRLAGPRALQFYEGVGHQSLAAARPRQWKAAVDAFLRGVGL